MKLQPNELKLQGNWILENNKIKKDATAKRIEFLKDNYLIKIGIDNSGWNTLYQDPFDSRYWELIYPNSETQGGGLPLLQYITDESAQMKYSI